MKKNKLLVEEIMDVVNKAKKQGASPQTVLGALELVRATVYLHLKETDCCKR